MDDQRNGGRKSNHLSLPYMQGVCQASAVEKRKSQGPQTRETGSERHKLFQLVDW